MYPLSLFQNSLAVAPCMGQKGRHTAQNPYLMLVDHVQITNTPLMQFSGRACNFAVFIFNFDQSGPKCLHSEACSDVL